MIFFKGKDENQTTQYIGIAVDEPKRLERLKDGKLQKISLLEKYGLTEDDVRELCRKYDLLSPIYRFTKRGGCWFCPNTGNGELKHLRTNHRDLWQKLLDLEKEPDLIGRIWNTRTGQSVAGLEELFRWEESQMTIFDFI